MRQAVDLYDRGKHEGLGVSSRKIWSMGLAHLDLKMTKK